MTKPTVLLDLDNTIFDVEALFGYTDKLLDVNYGRGAGQEFQKILKEVRQERGYVDWKELGMRFAKARNSSDYASVLGFFFEARFSDYLRPHAQEFVEFLSKNTNLVIFSKGDELFQRKKIKSLGLDKRAGEVIILKSKIDILGNLKQKYRGELIVIDDSPQVIGEAKKIGATTVWIKYGRHVAGYDTLGADLETTDLLEAEEYLKKRLRK
ncbi:hypothetical protein A2697_05090 [Candidatus Curtissbacteria bacterium RIFCSPHIGHO2_01_FULL_41_44]|uniref:FCP1 homology domain-containing protein n=1 Tax=Candidatus Curtissbacteria bacterium RIFCSPLOWO2_01_FULL_42_50 TaxID=1797730 RepID=A0A1F5H5U7_9BACT|nr:MAG: hypothetical protein A2697_05090 [Candidatus Curtissbacteria bacterium RIFCSPHIGHO2_01_FULL_41_44]OGD93791.1 MAG: hypothetical protein A3C33_03625 [Candidatus Curtissbacteria bacterium RIFCSPHIGHO2_02_FULL_42_58]OGD96825.1 MAG: hypothetical protein A3E71_02875 [Candidatus Curtissbacteria bacterium RIFCSPHIGHO2_12_FULL_42_33]OGD99449.1 MAG: hypothetical protein A3B54_00965 [Candidatus Curtissbacteria bacterium RIFCSPLOWO2_01_FULL_42_50]OGE03710.1 MAG: hypothetical protein A3G16_02465 [Ca